MKLLLELLAILIIVLRTQIKVPQPPKIKFLRYTLKEGNMTTANVTFGTDSYEANPHLKLEFHSQVGDVTEHTIHDYGTTSFVVSGVALGAKVDVYLTASNPLTGKSVDGPVVSYTVPSAEELADPVVPTGLAQKSTEFVE